MYKSRESHLQYVPPSLILLPSGSCSETNSHRCGHICQQHRACVIHRYGELKRFSLSRSPPVTHTHTHLCPHICQTLASPYKNAAISLAVLGGHADHHSCFGAEDSQERQVWTLCSRPLDQLRLSKWVSLKTQNRHWNSALTALRYRVRQQLVSLWRGKDLLSGSGITECYFFPSVSDF